MRPGAYGAERLIIAGFQKMLLYVGGWDEWELKQKESKIELHSYHSFRR
jgi:hypothetical protein